MDHIESGSMIWRHVMLALPEVESVPTDVRDKVVRLVRGLEAELEVFHCLYDPQLGLGAETTTDLNALIADRVAAAQRRLERVADSLRDQHLEVRTSVHFDRPIFEAVIRHVLRQGPNLLILPAARVGHAGARTLTYTDARLIEACPCPLLLMKTEQLYSKGPIVAAIDPMHARGKPAELDEIIVAAAKTLSNALKEAPVQVYHSVALLREPVAAGVETEEPVNAERQKACFMKCEAETRRIAARYEVPEKCVRVETGGVEFALPTYAREARADAVVMGAISRSYPDRVLFGYTAEKVLDALDCDVLIVKPKGFRSPVSRRPRPVTRRQPRNNRASAAHAP